MNKWLLISLTMLIQQLIEKYGADAVYKGRVENLYNP